MESIQKEILRGLLVDWGVGEVATFSALTHSKRVEEG